MSMESPPSETEPWVTIVSALASLALFLSSLACAWIAVFVFYAKGDRFATILFIGLAVTALGACFDPINFLWACLPFTSSDAFPPTRFPKTHRTLLIIGIVLILVGWGGYAWFS